MTLARFTRDHLNTLPTPQELKEEIPCRKEHAHFVQSCRKTIEAILNGWDPRLLLIVGPCSIHDADSALEYASRLRALADRVSDRFFLVMRAYFEKSRTSIGWKGFLYDPDLNGSYNLAKGMRLTRKLLVELTNKGVPVGSELLEIISPPYYSEFLSWGCIGARTSASPPHRQLAASLPLPIGFKNTTDGNIDTPIHAIMSANRSHVFLGVTASGQIARMQTKGNPLCHVVLRGGCQGPNYYPETLQETVVKCQQANIFDKLIIDCSHDNCAQKHLNQITVFGELVEQIIKGNCSIRGIMLESHLHAGSQSIIPPLQYGVSITDPCLDWKTTEEMIENALCTVC